MKAILIDPYTQSVTSVEVDSDNTLKSIYNLLDVQLIEVGHYFPNGDVLYVDEEGLLNMNKEEVRGFRLVGNPVNFVGKGLIVGTSDEGSTVSAKTKVADIEPIARHLIYVGAE